MNDRNEPSRTNAPRIPKKVIVVAGVSGCGKSTIGRALAKQIGWRFLEADVFHSESSKAKMTAGVALDDADRAPWLATLNAELLDRAPVVLACSALKRSYRERLAAGLDVVFVWITLTRELAMQRVADRANHFMPASLVDSQFETAETPRDALFLSASDTVDDSVQRCSQALADFVSVR